MAMFKSVNVIAKLALVSILLMVPFYVRASGDKVTGTYSSLRYDKESGDLLGYEILIIPIDTGLKAVVQVAEGAPGQVYIVEATQKGETISFEIPLSTGIKESFSGRIVGDYLVGDVLSPSGKEHVQLKRGMSYWDK
jgi:hypothetical protein